MAMAPMPSRKSRVGAQGCINKGVKGVTADRRPGATVTGSIAPFAGRSTWLAPLWAKDHSVAPIPAVHSIAAERLAVRGFATPIAVEVISTTTPNPTRHNASHIVGLNRCSELEAHPAMAHRPEPTRAHRVN